MATNEFLLEKRLLICVGAGGVGKTTTAAALAVAGARHGRRAAVITVDPSQRLKDTLGLDGLASEPHPVAVDAAAHFDAFALDAKRTFDALVERLAPSRAIAARLKANRLYQEIADGLAGSAEYMAMEKLHELVHHRRYQLVVVDTPPSAHVRDLLAAPNRLLAVLASSALTLLQAPAHLRSSARSQLSRFALTNLLTALQRWTGVRLLEDLADLAASLEQIAAGFGVRSEEVDRLLHEARTAFVLITSAEPHTVDTTIALHEELRQGRYPIAGIVANRVIALPGMADAARGAPGGEALLQRKLQRNYARLLELSRRDASSLQRLQEATQTPVLGVIPAVTDTPLSLAGLARFAGVLVPSLDAGTEGPRRGPSAGGDVRRPRQHRREDSGSP